MTLQRDYLTYRWRHNAVAWLWAGLLAVGMNLTLFNLIPNLLHPASPLPVFDRLVPQINVIRVKRPERPVKPKTPKPIEPEVKRQNKLPQPTLRRTPGRKLSLAFETQTKLPGDQVVLQLPPMVQPDLGDLNVRSVFSAGELDQPLVTLARDVDKAPASHAWNTKEDSPRYLAHACLCLTVKLAWATRSDGP